MDRPIIVLDLETTGLDPCTDCIVEIGACSVDSDLRVVDTFHSRVRPTCPVSLRATLVHGMTFDDLRSETEAGEVLADFVAWSPANSMLSGQNVWFDALFLRRALQKSRISNPFDYHILDLWSVASFVLPGSGVVLPTYDLDELCKHWGIARPEPHDALSDALASAAVYRELRQLADKIAPGES